MSLRVRTALIGIVIAVLASTGAAASSYLFYSKQITEEIDQSLTTVSWFYRDEVRRSPFADPISGQDLGRYAVQAVDENGKTLLVAGTTLPVDKRDIQVALGRVGYDLKNVSMMGSTWRIRTSSTRYGAIQVAVNYDEAIAALGALRYISVLIAFIASLVGAGISWYVTGRAVAPLRDLTRAVEQIAGGELDVEVSSTGSSEVGRLAGAFNTTVAALRRSRAEQRRLVQDAGHDLRTPLTSLLNNIALLRKHRLDPAEEALVLDDLAGEAKTLKTLVDEIIDVASGAGTTDEFYEFDIHELVEEVSAREARRSGRNISVSGTDTSVTGQPQSVERAVANLVGNAVKYSQGDIEVDVRRTLRADGTGLVWVEVSDRGVGLQGSSAEQLFERFWRADSARSSDGSGLGLAIVKDIAARHDGQVFARDRDGGGAVIGFSVACSAL
jgi:two-component system sensor histidine kinase MprB